MDIVHIFFVKKFKHIEYGPFEKRAAVCAFHAYHHHHHLIILATRSIVSVG